MDKFFSDFDYFWELISKKENFTFARYADGEVLLMRGSEVKTNTQAFTVDKWCSPNGLTKVGDELLMSLNHTEENYYYAISAPTDNILDFYFLNDNVKQNKSKISFVNLWINANYNKMIDKLKVLDREVILICNHNAKAENFPFKIKDITHFPDDCINFWDKNSESFINDLKLKYENLNNELFFISCGPISELIIHNLYLLNPNNSYIDVGSSIDEYVHGFKTRPYMNDNTIYSKMVSRF